MRMYYLVPALIVFSIVSLFIGVSDVGILDLFSLTDYQKEILLISRIPRLLSILLAGAGMSVVGLLMQQLTRNRFVSPTTALTVRVSCDGQEDQVAALEGFIKSLARVEAIEKLGDQPRPSGEPSAVVTGFGELFVALRGAVDPATVRDRLSRDLAKVDKELKGVDAKLARPDFVERAPAEIVDKERERAGELRERKKTLEKHLATLGG